MPIFLYSTKLFPPFLKWKHPNRLGLMQVHRSLFYTQVILREGKENKYEMQLTLKVLSAHTLKAQGAQ